MNPAASLCEHLRAPDLAALRIEPPRILDWDDGPITAIASCSRCGALGLIELLDWSRTGAVRSYALSAIDAGAVATFERNVAKGSCDLARVGREVEALLACAGRIERLVALDVRSGVVVATVAPLRAVAHPAGPWSQRIPAPDDESWFAPLGLAKSAV